MIGFFPGVPVAGILEDEGIAAPNYAEETPRLPYLTQKAGSPVTLWKGRPLDE